MPHYKVRLLLRKNILNTGIPLLNNTIVMNAIRKLDFVHLGMLVDDLNAGFFMLY